MSATHPAHPGPEHQRRTTMTDVAKAANISRGTVSRYLNNTSYVSATARKAIAAAIADVGYVPSAAARSLAGSPSRNIALIVHERANLFADDHNLVAMMVGANRKIVEHKHQLMVMLSGDETTLEQLGNTLAGGLIDGVMLAATRMNDPLVELVRNAKLPAAIVGRQIDPTAIAMVDVDNVSGAREITTRLIATGRRKPAILAGPADMRAAADRLAGFQEATGDLFDATLVRHTPDWSYDSGKAAMAELLQQHPDIDAVFGACDAIAVGAISALTAAGKTVPGDVGVVGFDNSPWAEHSEPSLSTVAQPAEALGVRMAELVLRQLNGEDLAGTISTESTQVVWRDSA